jgi:hypothetical protein
MLKMRIVTDRQELSSFAEKYGVDEVEGLCLYLAENRGEPLGVCFYRFIEEGMEILYADAGGDAALFDGLIRAAMAALFDRENDRVLFAETMDRQLLKEYRFITGDKLCIKSANEFFQTCKNCKN